MKIHENPLNCLEQPLSVLAFKHAIPLSKNEEAPFGGSGHVRGAPVESDAAGLRSLLRHLLQVLRLPDEPAPLTVDEDVIVPLVFWTA